MKTINEKKKTINTATAIEAMNAGSKDRLVKRAYGGPGCGKTTYVLDQLNRLLGKVPPKDIAFVSFTNKGVNEGVERAYLRYNNVSKEDTPYWGTLHSICNKIACNNKGKIITSRDYKEFSRALGMRFVGYFTEDLKHEDDHYLFMNNLERTNTDKAEKVYDGIVDRMKFLWVKENYNKFKDIYKLYDFTDMLEIYLEEGEPLPVKYMIVDEAQDLSPLQWQVVGLMSRNCDEVIVAGDDDQAIYGWCGGDADVFNGIDSGKDIVLEDSYRLKENIIKVSENIIQPIFNRRHKRIRPVPNTNSVVNNGNVLMYSNLNDVVLKNDRSYYILSRNRCYLKEIKNWLMIVGVPFKYCGVQYPRNIEGRNKIKFNGLEHNYCNRMKDKSYARGDNDGRITVDTIHRVKGGEADEVVLLLDVTPAVNENLLHNRDEELRTLYVAVTRARMALHVVYSTQRLSYDAIVSASLRMSTKELVL